MQNTTTLRKPWDEYPIEYINITKDELDNLLSIDEIIDIYLNFREQWESLYNLPGEVWTYVTEFGKRYSISCYGRLKQNALSIVKKNYKGIVQRIDIPEKIINGYVVNKAKYPEHIFREEHCHYTIYRLVAKYFIKKTNPEFNYIDHKNTIRYCAHILNLWWCNVSLNTSNPLTKRFMSIQIIDKFIYPEIDENASNKDNIEDYLTIDKLFSARMFTDVDFSGEIWKYIQEIDLYVSNYGRLKKQYQDNSIRILKQTFRISNYLSYNTFLTHYLVLYAFGKISHFRKYEDNMTIDHINTKTYDNRLINLRYVSHIDNINNEQTKKNMSEHYNKNIRSIKILIYDSITLEFIQEFDSIQDVSNKLKISSGAIKRTLDLGCTYKYKWFMFSKESDNIKKILSKEDIPYYNRKVSKYDRNGNFICSYDNAYEIRDIRTIDDVKYIQYVYQVCNTKKGTFNDCQWRYSENDSNNIGKALSHMTSFSKVNMYDYDGNFVRQFDTIKEIAKYFKSSSSLISVNLNECRKETTMGFYFRYVYNNNTLNLWDSGLFNNSENALDILNISKETVNVVTETNEIINVYDITDGYIIKRYYSKVVCCKELNITDDLLYTCSIVNQKYYIIISRNNDNFEVRIEVPKKTNTIIKDYIDEKLSQASNNIIVVYNYFTDERIGEYILSEAEYVTGIKSITIINCCDGLFEKAVNMDNLETYSFCYLKDDNDFEINKENIDNRLFALYNVSDKLLYKIFYTVVELTEEIGYRPNISNKEYSIVNGKYILSTYIAGEYIPDNIEINKTINQNEPRVNKTITPIIDHSINFNNQYYRSNDYKILKFSLQGEFIESFNTFAEITNSKTKKTRIRECANHVTKSAYGYQWRFSTECSESDNIGPVKRDNCLNFGRIIKYSMNDEYIEVYQDLYSVPYKKRQREVIHQCAMGKRWSAYGFKWKYEKDVEK